MRILFNSFFTLIILLSSIGSYAQTAGASGEMRFLLNSIDCTNNEAFVYVQLRAAPDSPSWLLKDSNMRWSYTPRTTIAPMPWIQNTSPDPNPQSAPIYISDMVTYNNFGAPSPTGGVWFECGLISTVEPHDLVGSIDTVISYNFSSAGQGICMEPGVWRTMGEIRVEILDGSECFDFIWHPSGFFPESTISEVDANGVPFDVPISAQTDYSLCFDAVCNPLPIELASFSGKDNDCENLIEWSTVTEKDNAYFILESSSDGINYREIARVEGAGTTSEPKNYSFIDKDIDIVTYYQLVQVDLDGKTSLAGTITVSSACFGSDDINTIQEIFPNPVADDKFVNIKFYTNQFEGQGKVIITDVLGRIVDKSEVEITVGPNTFEYGAGKLAAGTYFAQIQGADWFSKPMKFVKIHK